MCQKYFLFTRPLFIFILLFSFSKAFPSPIEPSSDTQEPPLRLAIIGLVHDHVHWIFNRKEADVQVVGIVETNTTAIAKFQKRYGLPDSLFFDSYESLYQKVKPEAVSAFNQTNKHLEVVEFFAPLHIPIMVEKPLAASYEEAKKIEALYQKYKTPILTNYETSWYESTYEAKKMVEDNLLGGLTKMVFNTGHPGPQEIGCSPEFLEWLTDPIQNGAGALTDFGCYGANIATWFLNGKPPVQVSAVAKQTKPNRYPNVDDDTTIILEYPDLQVVIQASWNWSHHRKDMQVYGSHGYINSKNANEMSVLEEERKGPYDHTPEAIELSQKDPFRLLYEVTKNHKQLDPFSLYSLENNMMVSKILTLAKKAAEGGQTLQWNAL
jgi:predicted dehydrogenase